MGVRYVFLPTNLQILHGLLRHLRLRITLCPQGSQVGGIKGQMSRVCRQAVVEPGPLVSVPQQRFHGLQPQSCCALVRPRFLLVTCQEAARQRYITTPTGEPRVHSPRIL